MPAFGGMTKGAMPACASMTISAGSPFQFLPDLLGGGGEHGVVFHLARMRLQRLALFARDDVDVKVEHGLAGGGAVELLNENAIRAHGVFDLRRELLHHGHELGEACRRNVEEIPRLLLGDDERM